MSQSFIRSITALVEIISIAKLQDNINLNCLFPCMGGTLTFGMPSLLYHVVILLLVYILTDIFYFNRC